MDITYQYTKKRRAFGAQPMFCEQGPELCDSIPPSIAERKQYILRNPVHKAIQHTPSISEQLVNTTRAVYSTSGANHAEGGWPKDVVVTDPEATQRYRRKIEKDDNYINCVMSTSAGIDHYAHQNNAIDMYRIYYSEMAPMPAPERISCRIVNVYRDPPPVRSVGSICWQPDGGTRLAVSYNDVECSRIPHAPLFSYIWDVENANQPELSLLPPCALLDLQFNPRDQNTLAGGLLSGQVGVWDRRLGGGAKLLSPPHVAHRDLVRSVLFINAKSGQEFFSSGPDGVCKWWDMRNMDEPTDEMIIAIAKSSMDAPSVANSNGVSVLEFEPTIPTRFLCGTENGLVLGGNRKGKTPMEKISNRFEAHLGPVCSLQRHPAFLKNFLTIGDWTARVWSEECHESALIWSPPHRHKVTAGTWSPTRLSVLLLTQYSGVLEVWDLLRRQREPALSMQVCDEPLLRMSMHEAGSLLACGSQKGNVYLVEMSQSLSRSDKADKGLLTAVLEREAKRERILEVRMREIRLKQRQAEEGSPAASLASMEPALGDRDLADATIEFFAQVKKEQGTL